MADDKKDKVFTNNQSWLKIIEPFTTIRGLGNKGKLMGKAKDDQDNLYNIYPDECGLKNNCFCGAKAEKI